MEALSKTGVTLIQRKAYFAPWLQVIDIVVVQVFGVDGVSIKLTAGGGGGVTASRLALCQLRLAKGHFIALRARPKNLPTKAKRGPLASTAQRSPNATRSPCASRETRKRPQSPIRPRWPQTRRVRKCCWQGRYP